MKKDAFLFVCHKEIPIAVKHYQQLLNDISERNDIDLYILWNYTEENKLKENDYFYQFDNKYDFDKESCMKLGFKFHYYYLGMKKDFYGNNYEYSFLSFYLTHPNYEHYWICEYDVEFSGDWNILFDYFKDKSADLIANHIKSKYEFDDYYWTHYYNKMIWFNDLTINPFNIVSSFNPFFRISNRAIKYLAEVELRENYGFFEIFMPTVLKDKGFEIKKFGGRLNEYSYDKEDLFVIGDAMDKRFWHNIARDVRDSFTAKIIPRKDINVKNKLWHKVMEP